MFRIRMYSIEYGLFGYMINYIYLCNTKPIKTITNMKKYTVNVHYDYVTTVEVEADNEEEAIDMAESIAVDYTGECVSFTNSCITNVEDLDLENII